jgi:uncharacterized YigZ family protein
VKIITSYQTVLKPAEGIFTDSGSRFLAYIFHLNEEEQIKNIRDLLKKEHHKAVHVVWAARIGLEAELERFSDDGEPSGSAGRPVLNVLKSAELTQIGIFVVRYFGGKKLGIPGLIHAYSKAAELSIDAASIVTIPIKEQYQISCKEPDMHMVIHEINKAGAKIISTEFAETCNFIIELNCDKHDKVIGKLESLWQIEMAFIKRF